MGKVWTESEARKRTGGSSVNDQVRMDDGRLIGMREFWAQQPSHFPAQKKLMPQAPVHYKPPPNTRLTPGGQRAAAKIRAQFGPRGTKSDIIATIINAVPEVHDVVVDDERVPGRPPGVIQILCTVPEQDRGNPAGLEQRVHEALQDCLPVAVTAHVKIVPPLGEAPKPKPKRAKSLLRRPSTDWWPDESKPKPFPKPSEDETVRCAACLGSGRIKYVEGPAAGHTIAGDCPICRGEGQVPRWSQKPACPWCGSFDIDAEFVDNGVGMQQVSPYLCGRCGASEFYPNDHESDKPTRAEKRRGWWAGPPEQMTPDAAEAFIAEELRERLGAFINTDQAESRERMKEVITQTLQKLEEAGAPIVGAHLDGDEIIITSVAGPPEMIVLETELDTGVKIE